MIRLLKYEARRLLDWEPWWAEFCSATTAVLWTALTYFCLGHFQDWPSMRVLNEIGDERFWHLLGFGLGSFQIAVLAADWRWGRWLSAAAQGWFWGILTLGVWVATPWSPTIAIYAGWCAVNVLSIMRLHRPVLCSAWPVH